ncbi:MAG: membrane or secreted protein [Bacteroidota bacterium]
MSKYFLSICVSLFFFTASAQDKSSLQGAWQREGATITFAGDFFSYVEFDQASKVFKGTRGGSWSLASGQLKETYEFDTWKPEQVGSSKSLKVALQGNQLMLGGQTFTRLDDGKPGQLHGAWLITGRMQEGEIRERKLGPRKTMKILSGTRFQWIAYNTETKEFRGTGGGSYTTENGKYVEHIEFFSRDSSRVGASLSFDFSLKEGKWHHQGKSSKGNPIYEIWSLRE